jgi:hypothetical protein
MSIKKWAVSNWGDTPIEKEYSRETGHFYIHMKGRGRDPKISRWEKFFDSELDALSFIKQRDENKISAKKVDRIKANAVELLDSLERLLENHTQLVNCGDCGNWDVELEPEVIAARAAIAKARGES